MTRRRCPASAAPIPATWRWRGVPALICGPSPISMGTDEEHVTIDEAIAVMKLHVACAVDYLGSTEAATK